MSRLDRKAGRFDPHFETGHADDAMLDYQDVNGDWCDYYVYDAAHSVKHSVYDEPMAGGRAFAGPTRLQVIRSARDEGAPEQRLRGGLYWTDTMHVTVPFAGFEAVGVTDMDIHHGRYVRDRVIYDNRVWRVSKIVVAGQVIKRDLVVGIDLVQLKSEDLIGDDQFSAWWTSETADSPVSANPGSVTGEDPRLLTLSTLDSRYVQPEELDAAIAAVELLPGPQGPQGAPGGVVQKEIIFAEPSDDWQYVYTGDFPYKPSVTCTTPYGEEIHGDVKVTATLVRVQWAVPIAGILRLQ